jgi:hypothetical protein
MNSHSQIGMINELGTRRWEQLVSGDPAPAVQAILRSQKVDCPDLDKADSPQDQVAYFAEAMARKFAQRGNPRWGVKDPSICLVLPELHALLPDARFIFIVRDPRGAVASAMKRRTNIANAWAGARQWNHFVSMHEEFSRAFPENCITLRYRDLLGDLEDQLRRLTAHIGVDFEEGMLKYYEKKPAFGVHSGIAKVVKPPSLDRINAWQESLSKRQIQVIEKIVGPRLEEYGHEPLYPSRKISWPARAWYTLHQEVLQRYWWQKRSNWSGIRKRLAWLNPRRK